MLMEVFRHCPEGVVITIPGGRVLHANPAACAMFGAAEDELRRLSGESTDKTESSLWRSALAEPSGHDRVQAIVPTGRVDGTRFLAQITSTTFNRADGEPRSFIFVRDVT